MNHTRHGHGSSVVRSPTYRAWESMMQRCYNTKHPRYSTYGGAGIVVCERWHSFVNFLDDMGEKPDTSKHLGRVMLNDGYTPQNCRWMTRKQVGVFRQAARKGWDQIVDKHQ